MATNNSIDNRVTTNNFSLPLTDATGSAGCINFNNIRYISNCGTTDNVFIGSTAGKLNPTQGGIGYIGIGTNALLQANHAAGAAIAIGYNCCKNTGDNCFRNVAIGHECLTSSGSNTGDSVYIGYRAGYSQTARPFESVVIGKEAHYNANGNSDRNVIIGYRAGYSLTSTESACILIGSAGTASESNVIRIGTTGSGTGQQQNCWIAGTYAPATAIGATAKVMLVDSADHIGGLAGTAGQILQGGTKPAFSTAAYPATTAQGDLLLSTSANTIQALTKDANATRYLSNTGTNNNAAWAQVALTTGVSGVLPPANGGILPVTESTVSNTVSLVANNCYIATSTNGATLVVYTLPATAAVGTVIEIIGKSSAFWEIDQQAGQTIHGAATSTTTGVTGKITTAYRYATVTMRCITADTDWVIISNNGAIILA